jgi:N1221-like protein
MEEITTEISVYLAMLYHLIEVFKGHDDFADELSKPSSSEKQKVHSQYTSVSMDPPLPVYFFNVVSALRDKSAKGYPVKKVLDPSVLIRPPHTLVSYFWFYGRLYCLVAVAFVISKESRKSPVSLPG